MIVKDLRRPEIRKAFYDGLVAFVSPGWLLIPALAQAAIMLALSFPIWFLGRCVLLDGWQGPDGVACEAFPALPSSTWTAYIASLLAASLIYVLLARLTLRRGLFVRFRPRNVSFASAFAVFAGLVIGRWLGSGMSVAGGLSSFGSLVAILLGPACIWLWRTNLYLWLRVLARRILSDDQQLAVTVNILLQRYLRMRSPLEIQVAANKGHLTVTGPLDAIDDRRVHDIMATRFQAPLQVQVETTLDDAAYWKSYRDPLRPSGYKSAPIPEPMDIPLGVTRSLVAVFMVLVFLALRFGPGLGPGISPDQIGAFYGAQGMVPPPDRGIPVAAVMNLHVSEISDPAQLIYEPFMIDVEGSADTCPGLLQTHWRDRRRLKSEGYVGPPINSEHPQSRYGDIIVRVHRATSTESIFIIDRATQVCRVQIDTQRSSTVSRTAEQLPGLLLDDWVTISRDEDWRYVPPRPLEETGSV